MTDDATERDRLRQAIAAAMHAKQWERARAELARLAARGAGPEEIDRLRHAIETELVAGQDWAASSARWKSVLDEFPDEPCLWPFAARCFMQTAEFSEADPLLGRLCEQQPDNFEVWMYYAINAQNQHRWVAAVERWDRAIALRPDDPNIKTLRGDAIWNAEMQAMDQALDGEPS